MPAVPADVRAVRGGDGDGAGGLLPALPPELRAGGGGVDPVAE